MDATTNYTAGGAAVSGSPAPVLASGSLASSPSPAPAAAVAAAATATAAAAAAVVAAAAAAAAAARAALRRARWVKAGVAPAATTGEVEMLSDAPRTTLENIRSCRAIIV
jgi:acyl dehydratase